MGNLEMLPWACEDEGSTKNVSEDLYGLQIILFDYSVWIKYAFLVENS